MTKHQTLTLDGFKDLIGNDLDGALEYVKDRGADVSHIVFPDEAEWVSKFFTKDCSTFDDLEEAVETDREMFLDEMSDAKQELIQIFEGIEDPERDRLEAIEEAKALEAEASRLQKRAAHLKNQALGK